MNKAKEKTALCTSVGADERQSVQNTISSISALDTEINHPDENSLENFEDFLRQMQRMSDPAYLHTVSMNELYETVYQSRPPVIDGLLYSGAYLFAGAPKVGKSFSWHSLLITSAPDNRSGIMKSTKVRFCTLRWRMIIRDYRSVCPVCSV